MVGITPVDRLVAVLRQRLERRDGIRRGGSPVSGSAARPRDALDRLRAIAETEGTDAEDLRLALVESLLADSFGSALANDPGFHDIARQVHVTLKSDANLRADVDALIAGLLKS